MAGVTGAAGDPDWKLPPELSMRELEILRLVAMGRTNGAIAHAMSISPRTVAKHLENVYRKLNVSSRAAAVAIGAA
jgi:DNA-binding CsgD family transcriptional regulator